VTLSTKAAREDWWLKLTSTWSNTNCRPLTLMVATSPDRTLVLLMSPKEWSKSSLTSRSLRMRKPFRENCTRRDLSQPESMENCCNSWMEESWIRECAALRSIMQFWLWDMERLSRQCPIGSLRISGERNGERRDTLSSKEAKIDVELIAMQASPS